LVSNPESHTALAAFVDESLEDIRCAAGTGIAVLITSRLRVERESLARLVHGRSRRRHGPFVHVACDVERIGPIEPLLDAADGGTLFLDEVGALRKPLQDHLYAVMEQLGSAREGPRRRWDVRLMAGTSHSLRVRAAAGIFNEDLFYRLNAIHLAAPAAGGTGVDDRGSVTVSRPAERSVRAGW
jgi:DNA-binding NtrC family response regulator